MDQNKFNEAIADTINKLINVIDHRQDEIDALKKKTDVLEQIIREKELQ